MNVKRLDPADVREGFELARRAHDSLRGVASGVSSADEKGSVPPVAPGDGEEGPGAGAAPPAVPDRAATATPAAADAVDGASDAEKADAAPDTKTSGKEAEKHNDDDCISQVAHNMCTNAYLIMYRDMEDDDTTVAMPTFLQAMVGARLCRARRRCPGTRVTLLLVGARAGQRRERGV